VTSLLGKLLRLFPESVPLEDLFTEAVARLLKGCLSRHHIEDRTQGWVGILQPGQLRGLGGHQTCKKPR
jgi:hypothetical protein